MIENCAFAEQAVKNPVPFNPVNLGDSINTGEEEYFPAITADAKTFCSPEESECNTHQAETLNRKIFI